MVDMVDDFFQLSRLHTRAALINQRERIHLTDWVFDILTNIRS